MKFGEKIKRIMFENNLTQKQFAEKIGTQDSSVNRWIKGNSKNPTLETLEKISKAFNIPISELSDDTKDICFDKCEETEIKDVVENFVKFLVKKSEESNKRIEKEVKSLKKEIEEMKRQFSMYNV